MPIMEGYSKLEIAPTPLMKPLAQYSLKHGETVETKLTQTIMSLFEETVIPKAKIEKSHWSVLNSFDFALSNGSCAMDGYYNANSNQSPYGRITLKGAVPIFQKQKHWYQNILSFKKSEPAVIPTSFQYNAVCVNFNGNKANKEDVFYDPAQHNGFVHGIYPGISIYDVSDAGDFIATGHTWLRGELPEQRLAIAKELLSHLVSLQKDAKSNNVKLELR